MGILLGTDLKHGDRVEHSGWFNGMYQTLRGTVIGTDDGNVVVRFDTPVVTEYGRYTDYSFHADSLKKVSA